MSAAVHAADEMLSERDALRMLRQHHDTVPGGRPAGGTPAGSAPLVATMPMSGKPGDELAWAHGLLREREWP